MSEERRGAPREPAYIAAEISVGDDPIAKLAVMQDASDTGLRLLTHTRVEPGDRVRVALQLTEERRIEVGGTVARVEPLEPGGPWRFRLGVALEGEHPELTREAQAIGQRQRG